MPEPRNWVESMVFALYDMVDRPVTLFREKIVEPNQQHYPWYHQKFQRVPTADECYSDDLVCQYEADKQYQRDRLVDSEILSILRSRAEECRAFNGPDKYICSHLQQVYEDAAANWFSKYGDLGVCSTAVDAYMKQKHRMVWERRHGPIGSGMKED